MIEDVLGVGKTTLAQNLAGCWITAFNRIQFTSDLLPTDILEVSKGCFRNFFIRVRGSSF